MAKTKGRAKKGAGEPLADGFQLKITLHESQPPIWRRVIVPVNLTLEGLHIVIQTAMGWSDDHLLQFEIGETRYTGSHPFDDFDDTGEDDSQYRLDEAIGNKKKFRYEYDFGDSWQHTIVVEKRIPNTGQPIKIVCTGGEMCCPLEDSGGLWGYYEKIAILNDKTHPEHEEIAEWLGSFDPELFDINAANKSLARLTR